MENETMLKNRFHEAVEKTKANGKEPYQSDGRHMYSFEMLQALRDMAKANVYPDGSFGDLDCNVWSLFNSMRY